LERGGGINRIIRRLKDGTAIGVDGVPSEMGRYGGEEIEE